MTKTASFLAAALMGAALLAPAADALAHDRDWGGRGEWRHDNGWHHGHHKHYRDYGYYYGAPAVVYEPYYVPAPPPPVVYRPAYYAPAPALTIGVSVPPLVIPLR